MAESTLSLQYEDFRRECAFLLGWQRDPSLWDNTQSTDFQDISERAQRQFYFPPSGNPDQPVYEWSFLRKTGSITLAAADTDYDMPDDFGGTILDKSLSYSVDQIQPKKIPEQEIRQLQSRAAANGYPLYYAVRAKTHTPTTGHRYEILLYPTPQAAHTGTLSFRYVAIPDTIGSSNIYPLGGAQYSEVLLASYLAAAEFKQDDDPNGPFQQKFKEMLTAAIRADENFKKNDRGGGA